MANEGAGAGADASGAGAAGADAAGGNTQGGATGAQGGADASNSVDHWKTEAKNAFTKRDALAAELKAEREAKAALAAELERAKSGTQGAAAGGSSTGAGAGTTFDPKAVETVAGSAAERAAQARLDAWTAAQNRAKLEDTVTSSFKAAGGQYEDLLAPKLEQAIKDGKVTVDAAGRVQGHEAFVAGLRNTHPLLFGPVAAGSIPGGSGATVMQDLRKANPDGRRGSLATGPIWTAEQRRNAEQALRKK